jgi:hypothetical protein
MIEHSQVPGFQQVHIYTHACKAPRLTRVEPGTCWNPGTFGSTRRVRTRVMTGCKYAKYLASVDWRLHRGYRVSLAGGRCEQYGVQATGQTVLVLQ